MVGPQAEREAVTVFREATQCSERRACGQLEVVRAMVRYRPWINRCAAADEKLRTLSIEDAHTREMLAIEVDASLPALRVVRV